MAKPLVALLLLMAVGAVAGQEAEAVVTEGAASEAPAIVNEETAAKPLAEADTALTTSNPDSAFVLTQPAPEGSPAPQLTTMPNNPAPTQSPSQASNTTAINPPTDSSTSTSPTITPNTPSPTPSVPPTPTDASLKPQSLALIKSEWNLRINWLWLPLLSLALSLSL